MTPEDALEVIRDLAVGADDLATWCRDGIGHAIFGVREGNSRFAVVSTPGDRWFEVAVNDDFGHIEFWEDATTQEAHDVLKRLVGLGMAYVRDGTSEQERRRFFPSVYVDYDGIRYTLSRSVATDLRKLIGRRQ